LKEYGWVVLRPEELDGKIDFERIFGRPGPVHIEIGSGTGTFLVSQAGAQPEVNFVGIEWARRYYRHAVDRVGRWGLRNVRLIRTDAAAFIGEHVADESVECFHIYFSDPWPKKRHHKRRLFNRVNAAEMIRCLKPAGQLRIATDHEEYFERIGDVVAGFDKQLEEIDFVPNVGAAGSELTGTNFERKYVKDSRPIFTLAVRKI